MSEKEYKVGEVFKHTDGKFYQCVEDAYCGDCAFLGDAECLALPCVSSDRKDGCNVKYIPVTRPVEGMLYRAENGRMYRLAEGSHWDHWCACDDDPERSCAELDMAVFGGCGPRWCWAPTTDYAPASDESSKPVESPKRHIELGVVKVEGDNVTFRIIEQTHWCDTFSRQANTDEFKAANGLQLRSAVNPQWFSPASALYCRGADKEKDMREITCTAGEFARICEAVADYNETDGKGCEPRWPQEGDRYFFVTAFGTIDHLVFYRHKFSQRMQAFGNFFRTEAEAKAALERIKQAMKGNDDLR